MIRILLAHDQARLRDHLARQLEAAGHAVIAVDRGTLAVPLLATDHFDVLLADIVMQEMDGIELAHHCRRLSPATRILFLTGFSAVAFAPPCSARGLPVVGKPFHLRRLVAELERALPSRVAPAAASHASRLQAGERAGKGTPLPGQPG